MNRKIIVTEDKSKTLLIPEMNETYHSTHGAINEAIHVFIEAGLRNTNIQKVRIFEMGFGTGLNALVTLEACITDKISIEYTSLEKYPLNWSTVQELDYTEQLNKPELEPYFEKMHQVDWESTQSIHPLFKLKKKKGDLHTLNNNEMKRYDIIYYDAFGPRVQPDLWTKGTMKMMFDLLDSGGVLVTYCAQGQFKRNLKQVGFTVENLPGPPGKREMTRAIKPTN